MGGRARKITAGTRGANLVEFAIVLVLLFLVLGVIGDLGRAFHIYIAMANSAREGARYGSRLPCIPTSMTEVGNEAEIAAAIRTAVKEEAATSRVDLDAMGCDITLDPDPEVDGCGLWLTRVGDRPLNVTVSCDFATEMSGAPGMFGLTGLGDFTMTSSSTMAIFGNDTLP
jgi:hypothetical protein